MNKQWRNFLQDDAGAVIENNSVKHFGSPLREQQVTLSGNIMADLSHYGTIKVIGDDAIPFLQGQLTNDINKVSNDLSQISGFCTPKGRLLALFRIFRREGELYLRLPEEIMEGVVARLNKYILMSKVTLADVSEELLSIGFSGQKSDAILKNITGDIPYDVDCTMQTGALTIIRLPGPHPRFEILGNRDAIQNMWMNLDVKAAPVGRNAWTLLNILAGIPEIHETTQEEFIPQMVNLHHLNGVSFNKGCYTGQEIVARLQYRGKNKRSMYLIHVESAEIPSPGSMLYAENTEQSIGNLVDAAPSVDGGIDALAVIVDTAVRNNNLHLQDKSGPKISIGKLPYPKDDNE